MLVCVGWFVCVCVWGGTYPFDVPDCLSVAPRFHRSWGFPGVSSAFLWFLTGSCHFGPFCRLTHTFIPMMMNGNSNFFLSVTCGGSLEIHHHSSCCQLMVRQAKANKNRGSVTCRVDWLGIFSVQGEGSLTCSFLVPPIFTVAALSHGLSIVSSLFRLLPLLSFFFRLPFLSLLSLLPFHYTTRSNMHTHTGALAHYTKSTHSSGYKLTFKMGRSLSNTLYNCNHISTSNTQRIH